MDGVVRSAGHFHLMGSHVHQFDEGCDDDGGHEHNRPEDTAHLDAFRAQLVAAPGFAATLLHAYQPGEDRT